METGTRKSLLVLAVTPRVITFMEIRLRNSEVNDSRVKRRAQMRQFPEMIRKNAFPLLSAIDPRLCRCSIIWTTAQRAEMGVRDGNLADRQLALKLFCILLSTRRIHSRTPNVSFIILSAACAEPRVHNVVDFLPAFPISIERARDTVSGLWLFLSVSASFLFLFFLRGFCRWLWLWQFIESRLFAAARRLHSRTSLGLIF